jgi:EmrB/QacA subfamily drug resistance transporter
VAVPDRHRWLILAVLCVSLLVVSLDNTILNVALPTIVRAMNATSSDLQWIVDAYAIVFAGLLLVAGSLGDRLGRKSVFLAGLAIFAAGSANSAFSATPDRLIAARAFMGIGAAAIMPSTLSILTNVFTNSRDRAKAIGIWSGTTGLGVAAGPVIGGWLLAHYWWGSVFLVNVPIALGGLLAAIWLVPNSKNPASRPPDLVGGGLSILGLGLLLWGIIEAPQRSWTSPLVLGTLGVAAVVLVGFVLWERYSTHPMLELSFFSSRRFSAAMGGMGLVIFALMGGLFLLTQYLQFSLGYTALQTGLRIAPIAAVLLVAAPLSSVLVRFVGTKPIVFTGMGLIALGFGALSQATVRSTYVDVLPAFFLMGVGTGLAFAPCTESVMGSLPLDQAGVGAATNSAALQIGGALGVGVLGSLLNTRYESQMAPALARQVIPSSVRDLITGSLGGALGVAEHVGGRLGAELADAGRHAFVSGMDLAVTVGAVVVGVAALVVFALLPNRGAPTPKPGVTGEPGAGQVSPQESDRSGVRTSKLS